MQDLSNCPICQNKLKNRNFNKAIQRTCAKGIAHFFSIKIIDKKVVNLNLYLDDYTSLEIDYISGNSIYFYDKLNHLNKIVIPKILDLDFPSLLNLKSKLSIYILFT